MPQGLGDNTALLCMMAVKYTSKGNLPFKKKV